MSTARKYDTLFYKKEHVYEKTEPSQIQFHMAKNPFQRSADGSAAREYLGGISTEDSGRQSIRKKRNGLLG